MRQVTGLLLAGCLLMPCVGTAKDKQTTKVDCDKGQTINDVLGRIDRQGPNTVVVSGTCTELVWIEGFSQLALQGGVTGATLVAPADPDADFATGALMVNASNSITIEGMTVRAGARNGIMIRGGASDVRLRDIVVEGSLWVVERGQVLASGLTVRVASGFGSFVGDSSDVHLEDSLFEVTEPSSAWSVGAYVASQLTMHNTTFRDFQQGIYVAPAGQVDLVEFSNFNPNGGPHDVLIESPAGTNLVGCLVAGKLDIGKSLRITNAGSSADWSSAGLRVENGGSVFVGGSLEVSGSHGQGVFVTDNSSVRLGATTIANGQRGGLVVVNQSTADVTNAGLTLSGNVTDIYCDSSSLIVGGQSIAGATTMECANLHPGRYTSPLP